MVNSWWRCWAGVWLAAACAAAPAAAQEKHEQSTRDQAPGAEPQTPERLGAKALALFEKGEYEAAEALLQKQLALQPGNFVAWYNIASCRAMAGKPGPAMEALENSVENGFCDGVQLAKDPALKSLHEEARFKALQAAWDEVLIARRDANLKRCEEIFKGREYTTATDDELRTAYRSAFNEKAFGEARAEITRIARWADKNLFPGILDPAQMKNDAWVVVVLPTRLDFGRFIVSLYGPDAISGNSMIGGAYEHDEKRLVSMDIGSTMRHEFFHVLHWRSCTRLGQIHPIWIQEGLCSLIEDYDVEAGNVVPVASWRINIAQRLEKINKLMTIEQLAAMNQSAFGGRRPLANYAQARAVFLYLYSRGKLKDWYVHYTGHFKEDPSGIKAIEAVLGKPIADVNRDYRVWLKALPPVPEQIKAGAASLGMDVDSGSGEGPVVAEVDRTLKNMPDSKTAIRRGDVITSIDGKPVRDIAELVRVLGPYKVGDVVEVEYRRVKKFSTTKVTLVPR